MDKKMLAFCGTYCGVCEWKDKINCKGFQECQGSMFWGQCDKALCCIEKGFKHCGIYPEMPCKELLDLFDDPEHGDKGARLNNLRNWANNIFEYEKLENLAQEQGKNIIKKEE